jgi:hypothetical protein
MPLFMTVDVPDVATPCDPENHPPGRDGASGLGRGKRPERRHLAQVPGCLSVAYGADLRLAVMSSALEKVKLE